MSESTLPGRPVATEPSPQSWQQSLSRVAARLTARSMVPVWLMGILLMSALFRFTGVDWDSSTHRHPDERFLTQVITGVRWPSSFSEYLHGEISPLNPRNNSYTFWVYGDLPITIVKRAILTLDSLESSLGVRALLGMENSMIPWDSYGEAYKVGRVMSGLFDLGTLLVLFLLARRLYGDHRVGLLAAFLYGASVLAIQHSHFWVVDNFATFFVTVTLYWLVRIFQSEGPGHPGLYAMSGLFFAASLATKISIFTLALLFGAVAAYKLYRAWQASGTIPQTLLEQLVLRLGIAVIVTLLAFRIFQPYAFEGPGLSFTPSPRWMANLQEVRGQVTGEADPPWGFQWANRVKVLFPWKNMVLWGMGLPLGLAAWAAVAAATWQMLRHQRWVHLIPVLWSVTLFLHQGTQWVMSMRYFLPIYPTLILLAAWLLLWLWDRGQQEVGVRTRGLLAWTPTKAGVLLGSVTVGTLLYALAFTSIYAREHTHIQALRWIYQHVPAGSVIAQEHYDEGVPWGAANSNPQGITYGNVDLQWYFEDNPGKLDQALTWLEEADYIVTVSNRLYGSTARLPARYPMTNNYYDALFSGELGFQRMADITSGPQLFGIELDDQYSRSGPGFLGLPWDDWLAAEEAFTVYDHQRVQIFQKTPAYDRERARALLSEGVDWNNVSRLTAKQWTESGGEAKTLKLTPEQRQRYAQSGTWSAIFDRASLQNRVPLLTWALLLELLGLLALPYLLTVARGLPGRGYTFAKPLGLLLVAWLIWLLASFQLVTFSVGGIALAMLLVGLGALGLLWVEARQRGVAPQTLPRLWWQQEGRSFLVSEGVFWLFFGLVLLVRWANPDIWHPDLGGERPMDLAYLNAVIKSPYFPPMDPWFAGGYINYYYFGFVLVATLIKFTGVVPEVAYNLTIPTLFAMLAAGVWGTALALLVPLGGGGARSRASTTHTTFAGLAAVLVTVAGNLGELKVLLDGLPQLSTLTFSSGLPGVEKVVKSLDGLLRGMLLHGQTLPGRMEWPYWNATRTIPDTINEFPWFTFLYADLHAHMMALPYTVLAIGLALAFLRAPLRESRLAEGLRLALLALVIGALWPINTWDFPTYALVAFAGLGLREWRRDGAITLRGIGAVAWRWGLILLLGRLFFQPFHASFGSAYNALELWKGPRTRLGEYLIVHGLFLFAILFALVNDLLFGRGHNGAMRLLSLRLRTFGRKTRAGALYRIPVRPTLATVLLYWGSIFLISVAILMLLAGWVVPALTLALLTLTLLLFFRQKPQPLWQMVLFFIMLGLGLTLAVEIVVLKGDIGRMNTVFKFYLQVWVLWGIAAALGAANVAEALPRWLPEWRGIWRTGFTTLFAIALLYPIFATHAKINDRFNRAVGPSLNGAAFMEQARYNDQGQEMELFWEAEAIRWVQENIPGSPTIVEMNTYPRLYGWGNRFAMWTGNPAVIGWDWHQRQQRAAANPAEVNQRIADVQSLYSSPDAAYAHEMLTKYGAEYLIVGALERAYAAPEGIAKFEAERGRLWDLVYENSEVRIYRVLPAETAHGE